MNIRLGDKVKFIDEVGGGTVVRLGNGVVTVEDEHGFQYDVAADAVILDMEIDYNTSVHIESDDSQIESPKAKKSGTATESSHHRDAKIPYLEVDLHIHHLKSGNYQMTNHEMVTMQMNYVKKMWSLAKENRYNKLVFIHGVGEGKLRYEIREYLSKKANCEFFDANIQTYGFGATEVRLWYN